MDSLMMDEAASPDIDLETESEERVEQSAYDKLVRWSGLPNIADDLDQDVIESIASKVIDEYEIDKQSREEAGWYERIDKAIDLAKQVIEEKSHPWPKASNTKYPLITVAAIQFAARAYPAIVNGGDIVKCKVNGFDQDGQKANRAVRVGKHMSYQLLEEMEEWEEDTDRLLTIVPIVGMHFRKSYFDSSRGVNVSCSVSARDLVWNYKAKSFDLCPRKTQEIELYPYEITDRIEDGLFIDHEYTVGRESEDDQAPELFLEQHRLLDLDDDGIMEPYVVTVHKDTGRLARIVARFSAGDIQVKENGEVRKIKDPVEYFTKYGFMPNPDGSAHDIGFCDLLLPLNESIDTSVNMMIDAGHKQIVGGGFIGSGLRMKGGPVRFKLGQYVPLDVSGATIRENLVDLQHNGPSPVLFQLLGFLVEAGRDISSVKDVMIGEAHPNQPASTTFAMVEQGMKMFSAIYKRIHRALGRELKKLYRLNGMYMPPQVYITFLDAQAPVPVMLGDYAADDMAISPAADKNVIADFQKLMRAEALMQVRNEPGVDRMEILRRYFDALNIDDIDKLFAQQQGPDPMQIAILQGKLKEIEAKWMTAKASMLKAQSGAVLDVAKAEAEEVGTQIEQYMATMNALLQIQGMRNADTQRGGMEGMGGAQGNPGIPGMAPPMAGEPQGAMGGGSLHTGAGAGGQIQGPGLGGPVIP